MRKYIPAVFLAVLLCLCFNPAVYAATHWQIDWGENGTLLEKVTVSGQEALNEGAEWQISRSDNEVIFKRNVADWAAYNELIDKLPLQATVKDLLCCKIITLTALSETVPDTLYASLDENQTMRLEMNVPGIILDSSAAAKDKNTVFWQIEKSGQSIGQDFIFRVIMVDGLGLGISILGLGVIFLAFFFMRRMRKVSQLIDETYSLDNIVIEEDEENEQALSQDHSEQIKE